MNNIPEQVNLVYQTFVDYYGEARVDVQPYTSNSDLRFEDMGLSYNSDYYVILVYWKEVTVTNEFDSSIDIWGLYNATVIDNTGKFKYSPFFIRSIYDTVQWSSNYCHSHVPSLSPERCEYFNRSCLGSGPINNTIYSLRGNCDLNMWELYCWELDKYVHVESLSGGPYRRLDTVGNQSGGKDSFSISYFPTTSTKFQKYSLDYLLEFIIDNNLLKYNYIDDRYSIGTPYVEAVMDISNAFIDAYNNHSIFPDVEPDTVKEIMEESYIVGPYILKDMDEVSSRIIPVGRELFTFKNKKVRLESHDAVKYEAGKVLVIKTYILDCIVYKILEYLNIYYGKSTNIINKKTRIL